MLSAARTLALALFASATLTTSLTAQNFTVDFTNCSGFAAEGPVSLAAATPLVPKPFVIAPGSAAGTANIVVRATSCTGLSVDPADNAGNGNLYVAAGSPFVAPYFIYGAETAPPPNSATVFLANWWYQPHTFFGGVASMRQQTNFPNISFGTSAVVFYTDSTSLLGKLIGGNADGNFSVLALRGVYPTAHMQVTVTR